MVQPMIDQNHWGRMATWALSTAMAWSALANPAAAQNAATQNAAAPNAAAPNAAERNAAARNKAAEAPKPKQRYLSTSFRFNDIDVGRMTDRLASIGVELPVRLRGTVSVNFRIGVPWTSPRNLRAYRFDGRLSSPDLVIDDLRVQGLIADVVYRDGVLQLSPLKASLNAGDPSTGGPNDSTAGQVAIRGEIDLYAGGDRSGPKPFNVKIVGNDVPLGALAAFADVDVRGDVDIDATAKGVLGGDASKDQTADRKAADRKTVDQASPRLAPSSPRLTLDAKIASPGITVLGQPTGLIEHRLTIDDRRFRLTPLNPIDTESPAIRNDRDSLRLRSIAADYRSDDDAFVLSDIDAQILGGLIAGDVRLAKMDDVAGDRGVHRFDLRWDALTPSLTRRALAEIPFLGASALTGLDQTAIAFSTSGAIDWRVPADAIDQPAAHRGTADVTVDPIRIGDVVVGNIKVSLAADRGDLRVTADGNLFGGDIEVRSGAEVDTAATWSDAATRLAANLTVSADAIPLSRVMPILRRRDRRLYSGTVSVAYLASGKKFMLDASGVQIDHRDVARRLSVRGRVTDSAIAIDRIDGHVGGGRIEGSGTWSTDGAAGSNRIEVRISAVSVGDALRPIADVVSDAYDASVTGTVFVTGGRVVRIGGLVTGVDSKVFGLPVGDLSSRLTVQFPVSLSRWSVDLASIRGPSLGGRLTGQLNLSGLRGGGFDMSGDFDARRVDLGYALTSIGVGSSIAHGDVTGRLVIGGDNITGGNDLRGRFSAELSGTSGSAVPGLSTASRYFAGSVVSQTTFDRGTIDGTIGGGLIRIEDFRILSPRVLVTAAGSVSIRDLRLDLSAVVSTGLFGRDPAEILALAATRYLTRTAVNAVVPGSSLLEVTRYLRDRTVYFNVRGTAARPVVQLSTIETARALATQIAIEQILPNLIGGALDD